MKPTELRLDGRVALVTGASRGLGRAVVRKLAASGCTVYLNARDAGTAGAAAAELRAPGCDVTAAPGDVSRPGVLPELLRGLADKHGQVDILVHCAVSLHRMPTVEPRSQEMHQDYEVAVAPLIHAAATLPAVMRPQGGRVIAVSSAGANRVVPAYVSLGLAKAALESLVRYLAVALAPAGVAVNAVSTARMDRGDATDPVSAALAARTPAGRLTRPDDIADAVALLCADEAFWLRGQVITVDGGLGLVG
ncbi:SDR family NAD(P)-dependent oxidoreductase [Kitasatospora sp. NPDC001540]|uniref:SDR family NAD(P)-dependent oxidoreductase n=1 Tax=Kitasatospora sp. NPDC001540 TaxID=3364014 RepID=UPI0036C930E7